MDNSDLAVRVTGLHKRYGGQRAVDGIDPAVARSEIVAVLGPNGAGRDWRARQLSGGQRRRLDVALGIVGRPELLFLDEPKMLRGDTRWSRSQSFGFDAGASYIRG